MAFKRQGVPFKHFLGTSNDTDEEESIIGTLEPRQRLLALTEPQQRVVKAVRKYPGSDAKTLGSIFGISRYTALAQLNRLVDPKNVLQSKKGHKPKSGAKATLYFYLAEDISADLVDTVFGPVFELTDLLQDVGISPPTKQQTRSSTKVISNSSDPALSFATMPSPAQELAIALAKAGDQGITACGLRDITGQNIRRVSERLKFLMEHELASRKTILGSRARYTYIATPTLKTIVEQFTQEEIGISQATPSSNVDVRDQPLSLTMTVKSSDPSSPQASEDTLSQVLKENQQMLHVMAEMARKINELESRFERIEVAVNGKLTLQVTDILAILHPNRKPLG
uniref:hypothetical protein n=1 Tax=Trichocoleus desertorum TaxID=1481672 RepID=UPI0025B5A55D|nr:hypothetical protein [Trichocoleus desertorum]